MSVLEISNINFLTLLTTHFAWKKKKKLTLNDPKPYWIVTFENPRIDSNKLGTSLSVADILLWRNINESAALFCLWWQ